MTIKASLTSRLQGHKSAPQPWKVLHLSQSHDYSNTLNRCHSVYGALKIQKTHFILNLKNNGYVQ